MLDATEHREKQPTMNRWREGVERVGSPPQPAPPESGSPSTFDFSSDTPTSSPARSLDGVSPTSGSGGTRAADPWIGAAHEISTDLGIGHYIPLYRRYKLLIAGVVAISTAIAGAKILLHPPLYSASTTILPSGAQSNCGALRLMASVTGVPPAANA